MPGQIFLSQSVSATNRQWSYNILIHQMYHVHISIYDDSTCIQELMMVRT